MDILNYVNGAFVPADSGKTLPNINPSRGQVYGTIPHSNATDAHQAVEAARAAFPAWSETALSTRAEWLHKLAHYIEQNLEEFARTEATDNGKPLWLARQVDIPRAISNLRFFAGAAEHFPSESHYSPEAGLNYTLRLPLGPVVCISPWNLPLYLFTWKIAPALAAGNTVVGKPSEITPATAYLLARACQAISFPKGVLNIIHGIGADVGSALVNHPQVKAVSFTGGTVTGRQIAASCAPRLVKTSLELGGKNAAVVLPDADLNSTVPLIARSAFSNQGQICLCNSNILVHKSIYHAFRDAFVKRVEQWEPNDPLLEETRYGALVSEAHLEKVLSYIELGKQECGKVLCGGRRVRLNGQLENGYFLPPTVFEGLPKNSALHREEIFGPVVSLIPFEAADEAVEVANATPYGLATTVCTTNLHHAHNLARRLDAGIVWINTWLQRDLRTPFGGIKGSGMGREGGWEAMRFFTEPRNVNISQ